MGYIFTAQCDECLESVDMGSWQAMREKMKEYGWVRKHSGLILCDECRQIPDHEREEFKRRIRQMWAEAGAITREERGE